MTDRPRVGVGVCVLNDKGQVLFGKRKNSFGKGEWSFPGGHLEMGESIEYCAEREVLEEAGVYLKNIEEIGFVNDIFDEHTHYITIVVKGQVESGEASVQEPNKCECWEWFTPNEFPSPLFLPTKKAIEKFGTVLFGSEK